MIIIRIFIVFLLVVSPVNAADNTRAAVGVDEPADEVAGGVV